METVTSGGESNCQNETIANLWEFDDDKLDWFQNMYLPSKLPKGLQGKVKRMDNEYVMTTIKGSQYGMDIRL